MNKKVYLQPHIKCAPLPMASLLASLSHSQVIDNTGGNTSIEDGKPDTDTAKEHWGSIDSWDSWEYPPQKNSINN